MDDPNGLTHHQHRHAPLPEHASPGSGAKLWARVEVVAIRRRPAAEIAALLDSDAASRRHQLGSTPDVNCPATRTRMGLAVVSEEQFDRGGLEGRRRATAEDVDDFTLALGHVQGVGHAVPELLAPGRDLASSDLVLANSTAALKLISDDRNYLFRSFPVPSSLSAQEQHDGRHQQCQPGAGRQVALLPHGGDAGKVLS